MAPVAEDGTVACPAPESRRIGWRLREESFMHSDWIVGLYIFILATFVGLEVIRRVSPLLHTPLMSLTNAISAIAVVGSIVIAGEQKTTLSTVLGTVAVAASMINVVGGYLITYRMLKMFKKRDSGK
jgi:NAD(P) transhydrogenase subunit alpha